MSTPRRSYRLFRTHTNAQLASIWNVSAERVRQLRIIKGYGDYNTNEIRNKKRWNILLKYLKNQNNKKLTIRDITSKTGVFFIEHQKVTIEFIKKITKQHGITVFFRENKYYKHGYERYNKRLCACKICKLANNIKCRYYYHGYSISTDNASELAAKYVDLYYKDKSFRKNNFYKKLDKIFGTEHLTKKTVKKLNAKNSRNY